MTELGQFAMFLALGFTSIGFFFGPIGGAVAKRIRGADRQEPGEVTAEVEALRHQVAALESLAARVGELEERLDFAERVLPRPGEPQRLAGGRQ